MKDYARKDVKLEKVEEILRSIIEIIEMQVTSWGTLKTIRFSTAATLPVNVPPARSSPTTGDRMFRLEVSELQELVEREKKPVEEGL